VDAENLKVLSAIKTDYGIAAAYESWQRTNQPVKNRKASYQMYLFEQIKKIAASLDEIIDDAPVIISGMASSSIGMLELPYKKMPFRCDGSDLVIQTIPGGEDDRHKIIMISGARSSVDVLRGEETILAGCNIPKLDAEQLCIFPGTHSKHLAIRNGLVENITTYMTGELFDLLSNKSILSASVKKNGQEQNVSNRFFVEGVMKGTVSSLSNSIFHVRTNQLFRKATPQENYDYLSGLLIGHELKDLGKNKPAGITLVSGEGLKNVYTQALAVLELSNHLQFKNADDALVNGQWNIMQQQGYL
jgi:2-dehydro-3-deoxygalactonokinase